MNCYHCHGEMMDGQAQVWFAGKVFHIICYLTWCQTEGRKKR